MPRVPDCAWNAKIVISCEWHKGVVLAFTMGATEDNIVYGGAAGAWTATPPHLFIYHTVIDDPVILD